MPAPALRDLITPTSTANGLTAAPLNHRLLLTLAMLVTGKAPDGTSLPTGAAATPPVAGYMAWYDASQITGHADNTTITTWPDLSGNGYTLTSVQGATYYSSTAGKTVNGLPAVWCGSTGTGDDFFQTTSITSTAIRTVFVVFQNTVLHRIMTDGINGTDRTCLTDFDGTWDILGSTEFTSGAVSDTALHCMAGVFNGASSFIDLDGTTYGPGNSGSNPFNGLTIGSDATGSNNMTGPICEVILYPSALSLVNRQSTRSYLKAKWGTP